MNIAQSTIAPSADLTPLFNELLQQQNAAPTARAVSLDAIEGFLKEAYRIVSLLKTSG